MARKTKAVEELTTEEATRPSENGDGKPETVGEIVDMLTETVVNMIEPHLSDKPKIDYGSPEMLAAYDFETQNRSNEQLEKVEAARREWEHFKGLANECKKEYETEDKRLHDLIKMRKENRGKPPVAETPNLFSGAVDEPSEVWPPADLWQQFPLERFTEFGLTRGDVDKLAAGEMKGGKEGIGPIDTMGAVSRFTAPTDSGWARKLTDVKGIGQATLDRYSEAETKFWAAWNSGLAEKFAEEKGLKKPEAPSDEEPPAEVAESEVAGTEDRQAA